MPCYLFTYHTYGSWMPDRPQGYVQRKKGVLPTDHDVAAQYRDRMTQDATVLGDGQQKKVIEFLRSAATRIDATLHAIATEPTHLHVLASWADDRSHQRIGTSLKRGLTIQFKEQLESKEWLSENRSRKRVKDREHFEHLISLYLPSHSGWCWSESQGFFKRDSGET